MKRSMVIALCACFLAAPSHAAQPSALGKKIMRAPARSLTKRIANAGRTFHRDIVDAGRIFRQDVAELPVRIKASREMRKLIKKHGRETVTYEGKEMELRQAFDSAKQANSVSLSRFMKYSSVAASVGFAALAIWSKMSGSSLEGGWPSAALGSAFMGVLASMCSFELKYSTRAARRETLQAAHDSGMRSIPPTALSYYGVVK